MAPKDVNSQILDKLKEIAIDVAATQQRVADMESSNATRSDVLAVRIELRTMEKRLTALEGKAATKEDLRDMATKDDIKDMTTKTDFIKLSTKLDRRFKELFDFLDGDLMKIAKKVDRVEQAIGLQAP